MNQETTTFDANDEISAEVLRMKGPLGRLMYRLGPRKARLLRATLGAGAGAVMGLGYYLLIGCTTGACPITSNPFVATLYGAVVGVLVSGR